MNKEVYLNPLIKATKVFEKSVCVELAIEKRSYIINREAFMHVIKALQITTHFEEINSYLSKVFACNKNDAKSFLENLLSYAILTNNLSEQPVAQIQMWGHYRWLNALIYHLKSQNIDCIDDQNTKGLDRKQYPKDVKAEEIWKKYSPREIIPLPETKLDDVKKLSFEEVLLKRRSRLPLNAKPMNLQDLSNLIRLCHEDLVRLRKNLEKSSKHFYNSRFVALETYLVVHRVEGLESGVYYIDPKLSQLSLMKNGDFREHVSEICIGQRKAASGAVTLYIAARPKRYMRRYQHERAYRNLLVNVAEFAQQYLFFGTALGFNTWLTPAIVEKKASELLSIDNKTEFPVYSIALG